MLFKMREREKYRGKWEEEREAYIVKSEKKNFLQGNLVNLV